MHGFSGTKMNRPTVIKNFTKYLAGMLTFLAFLTFVNSLQAQIDCTISINAEMPVCPDNSYRLSVPFHENGTYQWKENDADLAGSDSSIIVTIHEETTYSVTVTDTLTSEECFSDFVVTTYPNINITFNQLQLTCTNTFSDNPDDESKARTAVMQATAGDEFAPDEYHYFWDVSPLQIDPQDSSIAFGLQSHLKYVIDVKDNYGCVKRDTVFTEAYDNPVINIITDRDTAYIQNPYVQFTFVNLSEDSVQVINHVWNFGDCDCYANPKPECCSDLTTTQDEPVHTYTEEGTFNPYIQVFNQWGCDTIYGDTIVIKPVKLKVPNVFTPNNDGINDEFVITEAPPENESDNKSTLANSQYEPVNTFYERSELTIFNRQGRIVYQSSDYQNDWDGGNLPDAVYFYILKCYGAQSDDVYKGSVTIYGSGR